ncbi:hypothetical protein HBI25_194960 [Parastagonospora nodorum]|nr:hypothetical protein HBH53_238980 [Parastagonospora nodorum]KAH3957128.1 hypothetical protein HBH51_229350 [Parastagonospora nodorum]KAH3993689.1 hypothetical protein HBI10_200330 [Parastagonospora nodorum]KAH4012201.1 hypothetical protein HBI13_189820 [Parastagonospora nodorum]KAH4042991.1 hypothetical protein HBH49_240350 [Parastagonospora nodorum]
MPPKVHLIRHAQGEHNVSHDYTIPDAVLTAKGKEQCRALSAAFPHHQNVETVFASPLRRTIQTAALSFGPTLARKEVPFILLPGLQEVGNIESDTGIADTPEDLRQILPALFAEDELTFELEKIDSSALTQGWNSKASYWAYEKPAISRRAADVRNWLFQRPEAEVIVVTHGAIAHFLTEDWDVEDPMIGTAYKNCEHREFVFTSDSTSADAHVEETERSRARRGPNGPESDPHVLDEMKTMQQQAKDEVQ